MEAAGFEGLMRTLKIDDSRLASYDVDLATSYADLASLKGTIESQLTVLSGMLTSLAADMHTPLVRDGFPRSDIDVVGIRLVRVRIIRLQNDLKKVCERLAVAMGAVFASGATPTLNGHTDEKMIRQVVIDKEPPFAIATEVDPRGPAFAGGLRDQDLIVSVDGNITANNHNQLSAVAERVRSSQGSPVRLTVLRDGSPMDVSVLPSPWEGQGLLGCRLVLF